jgi:hypothetical protein
MGNTRVKQHGLQVGAVGVIPANRHYGRQSDFGGVTRFAPPIAHRSPLTARSTAQTQFENDTLKLKPPLIFDVVGMRLFSASKRS